MVTAGDFLLPFHHFNWSNSQHPFDQKLAMFTNINTHQLDILRFNKNRISISSKLDWDEVHKIVSITSQVWKLRFVINVSSHPDKTSKHTEISDELDKLNWTTYQHQKTSIVWFKLQSELDLIITGGSK